MTQDVYQAIQSACYESGLTPPPAEAIVFDGKIRRYHDSNHDKHGECNGWIKAVDNGNGSYGGSIGHWKLGCKKNWSIWQSRFILFGDGGYMAVALVF